MPVEKTNLTPTLLLKTFPRQTWVLVFATLLVSAGCVDNSQPNYSSLGLVEVSGTVTLDEEPVPNAAICFYEPDGIRFSYGMTDESGNYSMMFNSKKSGVMPGRKSVKISTADIPLGAKQLVGSQTVEEEDDDARSKKASELIPAKYNRKTNLEIDVQASKSNQDFHLKS